MAEPIVRTFQIDTGSSEQKLNALGSAIDSADNAGKSLKAQLRELNQQLANTDPQTQKYRDLSIAAGELKDRMQDAAQAVGTQAGGAFEKVSGSIGLVTSRLFSLDFQGAAEGAKLFAQNAGSIKLKDVSEGVKGLTSTLGTLGKALLTNPIFLLGTVLVGIISNFEALKNSGGALGNFFTGISDSVTFLKDSLLALSDAIGLTNTKAAEQAEKIKQQNKEALDNVKEYANTVGSDVEKKSQQILQASGGNLKQAREKFKEYSDQVKVLNENLINEFNLIVERGGKLDEYQQQRLDAAIKENAAFEKVLTDINKSITEADQKAQDDAQN
jgi:enamine deaminase RidA (YjgF/YER057c/UK114 family)